MMNQTYFETFLVGGLALLVIAALAIAWLLWRQEDRRRDAVTLSLEGIGHEFLFNMHQSVQEIREIEAGLIKTPSDLPSLAHPQLNAILGEILSTDKRALAAMQATYQHVESAKRKVRMAVAEGHGTEDAVAVFKAAIIDGIATLYLWECHKGCPPEDAHSTRSWAVRAWMKAHGFSQESLPGMALRDEVVDYLRSSGMTLTPKPLALTAHDYYARHYDRKADPRGVFGKRRMTGPEDETPGAEEVEAAEDEATPETSAEAEPQTDVKDTPEAPAAADDQAEESDEPKEPAVKASDGTEAEPEDSRRTQTAEVVK